MSRGIQKALMVKFRGVIIFVILRHSKEKFQAVGMIQIFAR